MLMICPQVTGCSFLNSAVKPDSVISNLFVDIDYVDSGNVAIGASYISLVKINSRNSGQYTSKNLHHRYIHCLEKNFC